MHVVMILTHMIRIRILEIRKGRRVSRPEGLASWQRGCRGIDVPKGVVRRPSARTRILPVTDEGVCFNTTTPALPRREPFGARHPTPRHPRSHYASPSGRDTRRPLKHPHPLPSPPSSLPPHHPRGGGSPRRNGQPPNHRRTGVASKCCQGLLTSHLKLRRVMPRWAVLQ